MHQEWDWQIWLTLVLRNYMLVICFATLRYYLKKSVIDMPLGEF